YLFSALLSASRPRTAILTSALLFGVFHVITAGGLAFERLAPSTLLGIVLGWLCWKSGSIVPGAILHAVHNSLLVFLGLYQPWLKEWGWSPGEDEHLSVWLLLGSVAGSLVGLAWIGGLPKAQDTPVVAEDD